MIYYKLYNPAGLINQLMSIELMVGIKEITNSDVTLYNVLNGKDRSVPIYSASRSYNKRNNLLDNSQSFLISDVLNWKDKDSYTISEESSYEFGEEYAHIENLMHYYCDLNNENEDLDFSEGRKKILLSDNMHIKNTLGWYSRFFNNRTEALDRALSSVKFLPEYYQLADNIARSLGDFNGAHLRLTDHVDQLVDTKQDMFDSGISKIDDGKKIVICTDQPETELLKNTNKEFILLDEYILNNFYNEFMQFKYRDEVSFGILNNLVMHYSKKFVGTIGSTYTSYIQRGMNQGSDIDWNWFDYIDNPIYEESSKGKYSWNGSDRLETFNKQWFREWKESRIV
jgi:hypothetical protein